MEWYRNKAWNTEIESDFEARLKRSRGTFHKAQYLKIQGLELLDTLDERSQAVGIRLLERLAEEYQIEEMQVANGNEALGEFYLENENFEQAEKYFRRVVDYYKRKSRNATSWIADLRLVETILRSNQKDKFEEAYQLIINYPALELSLNNKKFYFNQIAAEICYLLNKKDEAKAFAKQAIQLSKVTEPQFNRHKIVGIVNALDNELRFLERIISE